MAAARLAVLRALWSPTKTVPNLTVRDIRFIDFAALRHAGFDGVVFDKDNCLTHPREDAPVPHLVNTLREVTTVFPKHHVLVVSNSAGSYGDDVEWIEADAVERAFSRALKAETTTEDAPVHVLRHRRKKPSKKCAKEIYDYFEQVKAWRNPPLLSQPPTTSDAQVRITQEQDAVPRLSTAFTPFEASLTLNSSSSSTVLDSVLPVKPLRLPVDPATLPSASSTKPRLVFVGDRIMTDVLLANEMGAYSVLTTHLWKPNDVVFLRIIESTFLRMVRGWVWLRTREWRRMATQSWSMVKGVGRGMRGIWAMSQRLRRRITQGPQAKDDTNTGDVLRVERASVHPRSITPQIDGKKTRTDT